MVRANGASKPSARIDVNEYDPYEVPRDQLDVTPDPAAGARNSIIRYDPYESSWVASSGQSPTLAQQGPTPEISFDGGQATGYSDQDFQDEQRTAAWRIHWRAPALMIGLFVVGIVLATGHHFYYQSLDGTIVSSDTRQEWALRAGTAFAFLTHSSLVASAGTAYVQRLWVTVKRKQFRIGAIDNIFSLQSNPFSFLSWEVLSKAKVLCLLGVCIWCLPIASVITPATLSVVSGSVTEIRTMNVPYPDYTTGMASNWVNFEGVGNLAGPTPEVSRITAATLTSMAVLPFAAPHPNSSYSIEYYGPSFKCQNLSTAISSNTTAATIPASELQEAWDSAMENVSGTLDILYLGVSAVTSSAVQYGLFVNTNGFGADGANYTCNVWNTSYTVDFTFQDDAQAASIRGFELLNIADIDTRYTAVKDYSHGELQSWAMYRALSDALAAEVGWGSTGSLVGDGSGVVRSALAACPEMAAGSSWRQQDPWFSPALCRAGSVPAAIEDLSRNLTLSILGSAPLANETAAQVTVHEQATFYSYNWRGLVLAYAVAAAVTAACLAVGVHSLLENGYSAGTGFSSILLTTRNADLDELARGHCLGEAPLAREVGGRRLRYGILDSQADSMDVKLPHAAFGFADGVRDLKRGKPCW
ncbi:hypothetical protein KVR01_012634 [Diaporthe batatas]|uniref:uncharacterized protein n=1 Tax=Diaporthe batatas TaxID=748121 RepID=UPI001D0553F3|nr:uncharacterized protein KVR01_012634 [Diaporthe batatas]KAG8157592.1 hypothetical protein KVR01_012634 [Diaporthe batatas]